MKPYTEETPQSKTSLRSRLAWKSSSLPRSPLSVVQSGQEGAGTAKKQAPAAEGKENVEDGGISCSHLFSS